ncbi:MAG: tetraacyldisaccharide 4'-kinase, partial [Acidobacteriota bacterium]
MNPALKLAELLYRGINRARRSLYRLGVLRAKKLSRPVISIGNVSTGGAGKTPATIAVARFLLGRGYRVAVLTRGYGRAGAGGRVTALDPSRFGDEPVVIKKQLPNVDVMVGSNRYASAHETDADIYVLDDGFQHLQLHRDVDIVIDVPHPRFRREGNSALRHADLVLPRNLRLEIPAQLHGKRLFAFAGPLHDRGER